MKRVVVTGSEGYLGAHTVDCLEATRWTVTKVDSRHQIPVDINSDEFEDLIKDIRPDAIVHLAARKSVSESFVHSEAYTRTNVHGTRAVVSMLERRHTKVIVFASSAAVYSDVNPVKLESRDVGPLNFYGQTKLLGEQMLAQASGSQGSAIALRFFNLVGPAIIPTQYEGLIGAMVRAREQMQPLEIFGRTFDTPDGTAVRDYIDVRDAALAILASLEACNSLQFNGEAINIGSGTGTSVLEMVKLAQRAWGNRLALSETDARPGEAAISVADIKKATELLEWSATIPLERSISDLKGL